MKFKHGIPNHDAFSDLFPAIDARHTAARHSEGSQGTPATIGACFEDPKSAELTTVAFPAMMRAPVDRERKALGRSMWR